MLLRDSLVRAERSRAELLLAQWDGKGQISRLLFHEVEFDWYRRAKLWQWGWIWLWHRLLEGVVLRRRLV